jgi:hypothetical protein
LSRALANKYIPRSRPPHRPRPVCITIFAFIISVYHLVGRINHPFHFVEIWLWLAYGLDNMHVDGLTKARRLKKLAAMSGFHSTSRIAKKTATARSLAEKWPPQSAPPIARKTTSSPAVTISEVIAEIETGSASIQRRIVSGLTMRSSIFIGEGRLQAPSRERSRRAMGFRRRERDRSTRPLAPTGPPSRIDIRAMRSGTKGNDGN